MFIILETKLVASNTVQEFKISGIAWATLTIISSGITIFGIALITRTIGELQQYSRIKSNISVMLLHGIIIVCECVTVVIRVYFVRPNIEQEEGYNFPIETAVAIIDFCVQSLIFYICWTQGSST